MLSLRVAIADYVRRSRSVHCEPDQIVITPGIQQSLYICSQILFEAKDEVWIEDPAYRGTTAIFEHAVQNIRMVRVPVDEEGIQVETELLSKHARAAFCNPISPISTWHADESSKTHCFIGLGKTAKCMDH